MPSPFLLLGVGERGRRVGEAFTRALRDQVPPFLSLAKVLHEPSEDSCLSAVRDLLRSAGRDWEGGGSPVLAWIVGDLAEPGLPERIFRQADEVQRSVQANFPGLGFSLEALLFVPPGQSEQGKAIVEFLESLPQRGPSLRFCWLLSAGRYSLSEPELIGVGVQFLLLSFLTDLPSRMWAHGQLDALRSRLGTFGLSGVVVPARELSRREAAGVSAQILAEVLKEEPGPGDPRKLEDFFQRHRLSLEELKDQLREGTQMAFSEKEKKIALEAVDPSLWPDKLWSIYYFFAFGGLAPYFEGIRRNREKKWRGVAEDLARTVTDLVERGVRPASALLFLKQVEERAAGLKGDRVSLGSGKDLLHGAIEELRGAYRDLPSGFGAVLLRMALLAILMAYLGHLLLPRFLVLPDLPGPVAFLIGLGLSAILVGAAGLLSYAGKRNRFGEARGRAEGALWEALESALEAKAHNEAIELLERLQWVSASAAEGSEYADVLRYIGVLREAAERLKTMAGEEYPAVPVFRYVDVPVSYKKGSYSIAEEARAWVEGGLHKGWRGAKAEDVVRKLLELASAGLPPVKSVEEILLERREDMRRLGQELLERASPLVALTPSGSGGHLEARYLFVRDANSSPLVSRLDFPHGVHTLSTGDPHGVFLLRAFLGIAPEELMAFRVWKEGGSDGG
jgi:hypothetical protein